MPQPAESIDQNTRQEKLKAMLRGLVADGPDLETQLSRAASADYWRALHPDLPLLDGRDFEWDPPASVPADHRTKALGSYRSAGFLSLDGVLHAGQARRMRACIDTLRHHDWPPVFSFVYDAFWTIGRSGELAAVLRDLLGGPYRFLPRVWAHYVYPAKGNSGWRPHIDGNENCMHTVSVWVPLSEARLDNGCMHVVKRDELTAELSRNYRKLDTFTAQQVHALLRNTRALPASPGQILCWDEKIIHWGGSSEPGSEPRVSVALEFTSPDFPTSAADPLLVDSFAPLPSLEIRLQTIARAIMLYRRFELFNERFAPLAERLLQRKN